ncbi:potassium-transporting ATPase subunit KdpC [Paenibacillus assamensis]|uniref:potassium-transporting ATPase subunit KdpC n=1 Tax=Paenibacillus assamensis TaxID=311244 RepID=UPI0004166A8B|nr:potassium-transporting ATPase subunit KdpC [Paenibacillus assamensis]
MNTYTSSSNSRESSTSHSQGNNQGGGLGTIIRMSIGLMVLCGLVYPIVMTAAAQTLFPHQANGSLVKDDSGQIVGSALIGQSFTDSKYFHGRVSSIEYNGAGSGSGNLAPSNEALTERAAQSFSDWKENNPQVAVSEVPADLLTNSASGLDPHITPQAAAVQIPRIVKATGLSESQLTQLVEKHTEGPDLGLFGESRVNVLLLNIELGQLLK